MFNGAVLIAAEPLLPLPPLPRSLSIPLILVPPAPSPNPCSPSVLNIIIVVHHDATLLAMTQSRFTPTYKVALNVSKNSCNP